MLLLTSETDEMRGNYELKRIKGKGEKKWRMCLGHDCGKKILTTKETRFCARCKRMQDYTIYDESFLILVPRKVSKS